MNSKFHLVAAFAVFACISSGVAETTAGQIVRLEGEVAALPDATSEDGIKRAVLEVAMGEDLVPFSLEEELNPTRWVIWAKETSPVL